MDEITSFIWRSAWAFWLLPIPLAVVIWQIVIKRQKRPSVLFSQVQIFKQTPRGLRVHLSWLPYFCKMTALLLAMVALARPQTVDSHVKRFTEGIDIMLALDISGSMEIEDMGGLSRINAAKKDLSEFVESRSSDRIGLLVFKAEAYTRVPLTLDHDLILQNIKELNPASNTVDDGTAIGSALALAVARIKDSTAHTKVIVLATDGENNSGTISPETALEIAKGYGIRIYTIGMGKDGESMMPIITTDVFGNKVKRYQPIHSSINVKLLTDMASDTGGKFFRASTGTSLVDAFHSIDQLEKSKIQKQQYVKYREMFPTFLDLALLCLAASLLLERTIFARVP